MEEEKKVEMKRVTHEILKVDEDFPPLPEEVTQMMGDEQEQLPPLTIEAVNYVARHPSAVRVLCFLYKTRDAHYPSQLEKNIRMCSSTVAYRLNRLHEAGLVTKNKMRMNKLCTFYRRTNIKGAEIVLKRNAQFLAIKLARLIPYTWMYVEELKNDRRFMEILDLWDLPFEEAIQAMSQYYKLEPLREREKVVAFRRKEQGYVPEIRKSTETKVEEIE